MSTFKVNPVYKKSTYSNEYWCKKFDGYEVTLVISTQWRWGEFNITVENINEIDTINLAEPFVINDYNGEFIETFDGCDIIHEIRNFDSLSEDIKKLVYQDIYENIDEQILYDESTLEEEKGWMLDDTIYEIYGGINLEKE